MRMRIETKAAILCVLVLTAAACAPLTRPTAPAVPPAIKPRIAAPYRRISAARGNRGGLPAQ